MVCPKKGALRLQHPVMNRAKFVPVKAGTRKLEGELKMFFAK